MAHRRRKSWSFPCADVSVAVYHAFLFPVNSFRRSFYQFRGTSRCTTTALFKRHTYQGSQECKVFQTRQVSSLHGKEWYMAIFPPETWTSGFFPATLYGLNTRKKLCPATQANGLGLASWITLDRSFSNGLIPLETKPNIDHDVGFYSYPFVEELKPDEPDRDHGCEYAGILADRFNPIVGCTRSWNNKASDPSTDFEVIIDNMMNLEVFFVSAGLTGNTTLTDIAKKKHADTTMKNHFRADGSTYHLVTYNSTTGNIPASVRSSIPTVLLGRVDKPGLYMALPTCSSVLVMPLPDTAREAATFFLNHIPSNGIVPWDFNAPVSGRQAADSSAATIAANGLLLLSQYDTDAILAKKWQNAAITILTNITASAWKLSFQSLLSNGTVNKLALFMVQLCDYYYLRAGNELPRMGLAKCPS
ncbi:glucuronyl hydrolase [Mycena floridula]|nr:glucuronyl hydrolase [Mycena floridula]